MTIASVIELFGRVIVPLASRLVKYPAALVDWPIITPSKVEVEIFPYQVEVANAPVNKFADSVVKAPVPGVFEPMAVKSPEVTGVDRPMVPPSQVEVEIERLVATPADEIFQVFESITTASPLSPM